MLLDLTSKKCVLVADDDSTLRELLEEILLDDGYAVKLASDGKAAIAAVLHEPVDVVVTDLRMPGADGLSVLRAAQRRTPPPPVIILTAFASIGGAVEAIREGAFEYMTKPLPNPADLREVVRRALEVHSAPSGPLHPRDAVYADPVSTRLVELMQRVAERDTTVLLLGESGVGKEVAARQIHRMSGRASGAFVAVNCGAIPHELFESQMFGHVRGAFTGAAGEHRGFFEQAQGGTILLDEVAELPLGAQVKLLRVLEGRRITRVGDTAERPVDVRVVAATHRDLRTRVHEGEFREDLYYRLNVFPLAIPPLRERPGDILPLVRACLAQIGEGHRVLTAAAEQVLLRHTWPGNVRELRNVIERAVILTVSSRIDAEHLMLEGRGVSASADALPLFESPHAVAAAAALSQPTDLKAMERQAILDALHLEGGNRRMAARRLGIALRTLQYKLKEYGLTQKG